MNKKDFEKIYNCFADHDYTPNWDESEVNGLIESVTNTEDVSGCMDDQDQLEGYDFSTTIEHSRFISHEIDGYHYSGFSYNVVNYTITYNDEPVKLELCQKIRLESLFEDLT